eukprot:5340639-Pyramimonas_sp.AAC.1
MTVRFEPINDDRPEFASVGAFMFGPLVLAGLTNSTSLPLPLNRTITELVRRNSSGDLDRPLSFEARDECGLVVQMIPLMDIMFEEYTVYFNVAAPSFEPTVAASPSMETVVRGDPSSYVLADG